MRDDRRGGHAERDRRDGAHSPEPAATACGGWNLVGRDRSFALLLRKRVERRDQLEHALVAEHRIFLQAALDDRAQLGIGGELRGLVLDVAREIECRLADEWQ